MRFAFVRERRVRRRRRFEIGLLAMTLTAGLAISALAQTISPSTERLFDAVWADDLGRVKAAITAGANISAVNELGVRPVDMAVDRGHYGIAHYLLSVVNQRRDAATKETELKSSNGKTSVSSEVCRISSPSSSSEEEDEDEGEEDDDAAGGLGPREGDRGDLRR